MNLVHEGFEVEPMTRDANLSYFCGYRNSIFMTKFFEIFWGSTWDARSSPLSFSMFIYERAHALTINLLSETLLRLQVRKILF